MPLGLFLVKNLDTFYSTIITRAHDGKEVTNASGITALLYLVIVTEFFSIFLVEPLSSWRKLLNAALDEVQKQSYSLIICAVNR